MKCCFQKRNEELDHYHRAAGNRRVSLPRTDSSAVKPFPLVPLNKLDYY